MSSSLGTPSAKLPDLIKIDEITSGKIDPNLIFNELERLKVEINILRNDMSILIKALATIPQNQSQHEYYRVVVSRLKTVQTSIKDYCAKYNKLLPIINLAQIKLGHEVEIIPQHSGSVSSSKASVSGASSTSNGTTTSTAGTSVGSAGSNATNNNVTGNTNSNVTTNSKMKRSNSINKPTPPNGALGEKTGNTANQPIVI
ncbi:uncharacterized protein RJT20DRAFT_54720 [Scheffersomyces xylosifermentans]|uniref:uncharacterized protein n=1 Tax=Scheffersomyces xylosifermentans TaxID=1304137 RepID=UPI00315DE5F9